MKRRIFAKRVADHANVLSGHAFNFTKDVEDAKDLLQNTLLKALDNYETYKEGGNFRGWLYGIMKNTYINDYKKLNARRILDRLNAEIPCVELLMSPSVNLCERRFLGYDIKRALMNIDSLYAVPFVCHFEGYKYDEIADMLCVPIGTVKRRIHTARTQLKKSLRAYYGHEN